MNKFLKFLAVLTFTFTACSAFFATASYAETDVDKVRSACHAEGKRIGIRSDGSLGCGTGLKEIEPSGNSDEGIKKEDPKSSSRPTKSISGGGRAGKVSKK